MSFSKEAGWPKAVVQKPTNQTTAPRLATGRNIRDGHFTETRTLMVGPVSKALQGPFITQRRYKDRAP
jgi:hypothetical protein